MEVIDADFATTGQAMGLPRGVILPQLPASQRNPAGDPRAQHQRRLASWRDGDCRASLQYSRGWLAANQAPSGTRDYAIIQLIALLFAILVLIVSLVMDLLFAFLDPRIKLA